MSDVEVTRSRLATLFLRSRLALASPGLPPMAQWIHLLLARFALVRVRAKRAGAYPVRGGPRGSQVGLGIAKWERWESWKGPRRESGPIKGTAASA